MRYGDYEFLDLTLQKNDNFCVREILGKMQCQRSQYITRLVIACLESPRDADLVGHILLYSFAYISKYLKPEKLAS